MANKTIKKIEKLITPDKPVNVSAIQRTPQTLLSKEQLMLQGLFNQKNQFWGGGDVVRISGHLTTGNGLIKTGMGDATRRLFLP